MCVKNGEGKNKNKKMGGGVSRKAIAIWVNTLQEKLVIGKPCLHTCTALFVT